MNYTNLRILPPQFKEVGSAGTAGQTSSLLRFQRHMDHGNWLSNVAIVVEKVRHIKKNTDQKYCFLNFPAEVLNFWNCGYRRINLLTMAVLTKYGPSKLVEWCGSNSSEKLMYSLNIHQKLGFLNFPPHFKIFPYVHVLLHTASKLRIQRHLIHVNPLRRLGGVNGTSSPINI